MPPKYLLIPASLDLGAAVGAREPFLYSFAAGLAFLVDHAPEFARPASVVRAGSRLVNCCELIAAGVYVELRDDDWKLLSAAVESGSTPWGRWQQQTTDAAGVVVTTVALDLPPRLFLPWANAISEAKNELSKGTP